MTARNPFSHRTVEQIYALLTDPNNDLPVWPSEDIQHGYTSMSGLPAIRRTQVFISMLEADGAFVPGWKGLDYGAGWGRVAALLLSKGDPEQLDLVDAWDKSLDILDRCGYKNRRWKVSEILKPGEIPEGAYDFVYAFSVFTHLSSRAFWTNLRALAKGLRSAGTVYFTVRHPEFVEHKYPERIGEASAALDSQGFWFVSTQGDLGTEAIFGDTVLSEEHLRDVLDEFTLDYLGIPRGQLQHLYALRA